MADPEDLPEDDADQGPRDAPPKPRRRPPARRTPTPAAAKQAAKALVAADAAAEVAHRAAAAGREAVDAAREVAEDALGVLLDLLDSVAGTVRRALAGLMALGVVSLVLAGFAAFQPDQFRQSFPYLFAVFAGALGVVFLWLAWRLQGATSSLMTIARIAKKWRDRAAARVRPPPGP